MKYIRFRFKDEFTNGNWSEQECCVPSVQECIQLYGLGIDECEYEILEIKEVR